MKLDNLKRFHFIGIGGVGMSALAKILIERGFEVSGSDVKDSPTLDMLRSLGAKIFVGHKAKNIFDKKSDPAVDAIVCSSAIPADNPEVVAASKFKIPKLHRSDINAYLLNAKKGIAVAGSHGKTTTTSMIGYVLHSAGVDPTIIIGGESTDLGTGAILGKSDWLVSEADESDGTFVTLKPAIAVVTNIEDDHLDHYGTMDKIRAAFKIFIENVDCETGTAVLCFDNENLRNLAKEVDRKIISYAIDHDADFTAHNIRTTTKGILFEVMRGEKILGNVKLPIHGRHNVLNALATIATALQVGVSFAKISEGLSTFHGAKRRFQTKGRVRNVLVVDDYAHHPTEIATTLKAARETKPNKLICIFQPHRYSRTQLLLKEFGNAFREADELILTDVYSAGEEKISGVSGESILHEVLRTTNQAVSYIPKREDIAAAIKDQLSAGDLVITMGAGDIYKTGEELLTMLREASRRKIVVVCGGPSTEAEVSRRTGKAIADALRSKNYNVELLELNPQTFAQTIREKDCSIVFNAVHGRYGEDGLLQGTLDMLKIPYTGSGVLAAALTMDKVSTKHFLNSANISTPKFTVYREIDRRVELAGEIEKNFGVPVVIKAAAQGSSIGVTIVEKFDELDEAIDNAFSFGDEILVEEFIKGRELTVAVFGNEDDAEALPVIEITTTTGRYDYQSKYTKGMSTHIVPAKISDALTAEVQRLAVAAFKICKCAGVARVDIMLSEENVPYVIEVNSVPGMTETSLVPDAARAAGIDFPELCEKILSFADF
ncbi:MAG: UDP-N-acetylmuramate--L-alanine ligase [Selenomonadaceae bacterium]|nr:UDP-N-acetylmuramate--L-alanine ligase [Selenomonadaceae bacterium]